MKTKKKTWLGVILGLGLVLGVVISAFIVGSFPGFFRTVPKPEIKEGEFDFALTYEVDGEIKVIEGTYVCEFDGITRAIDGVGRRWNGYIKNHDDFTDYKIKTTDEGVIKIDLNICSEFFMSDPEYEMIVSSDQTAPEPYVYIASGDENVEDNPTNEVFISCYEGDDVKIISFEYDEPIENIYK